MMDYPCRFQDFYEEGERELLLTEVSELRNQVTLQLFQIMSLLDLSIKPCLE